MRPGNGEELNAPSGSQVRGNWWPPKWSRRPSRSSAAQANPNAVAVLVGDDHTPPGSSVCGILRTAGYSVFQVAHGKDALILFSIMRFEAMVLDLKMPSLDRFSLLSALSELPPIVLLCADEVDEEESRRVGGTVVAQLKKPVPPETLLAAVAAAVGRR